MTERKSYLIIRNEEAIYAGEGEVLDWLSKVRNSKGEAVDGVYHVTEFILANENGKKVLKIKDKTGTRYSPSKPYLRNQGRIISIPLDDNTISCLEKILQQAREESR